MDDHEDLLTVLGTTAHGVLVTLERDGRPQLSNIAYAWDAASRTARVSVTDGRAKTANLRRDPRASLHVTSPDFWAWTVVEGTVTLDGPSGDPDDPAVDGLVEVYRAVAGEHPDWEEFRRSMVDDRRVLVTLAAAHAYGQVPGKG